MKLVFTSDLRGNDKHYTKLFLFAAERDADAVILGGDILPRCNITEFYTERQHEWLKILDAQLRTYRKIHPRGHVLLMMGDDDARVNVQELRAVLDRNHAYNIHNTRVRSDAWQFLGYSCVPPSTAMLKDWEVDDLAPSSKIPSRWEKHLAQLRVTHDGLRSARGGWNQGQRPSGHSIESHLSSNGYTKDARNTIYVMHASPADTALDATTGGRHVGSVAIREFIERSMPPITLHGSVPESVRVSGSYHTQIGLSHCYTSGNDGALDSLFAIYLDTEFPARGQRIML